MTKVWECGLDYLQLRSELTFDRFIRDSQLAILIQDSLKAQAIPALRRRIPEGGWRIRSHHLDLTIHRPAGRWWLETIFHPKALHVCSGTAWAGARAVWSAIGEIEGISQGSPLVQSAHPSITFSGGQIGNSTIRRIQSRKKPWPSNAPYKRGGLVLYSKTEDIKANGLRKAYIKDICAANGYDEATHGQLWRLEFRSMAPKLKELGWPDMNRVWRGLLEEYPLMRQGSRRGAALDPAWRLFSDTCFTAPWDEAPGVWQPTPEDHRVRLQKALPSLEHYAAVIAAESPYSFASPTDVFDYLKQHYPWGSGNAQDLLDRIAIERGKNPPSQSPQPLLPFMADSESRATAGTESPRGVGSRHHQVDHPPGHDG